MLTVVHSPHGAPIWDTVLSAWRAVPNAELIVAGPLARHRVLAAEVALRGTLLGGTVDTMERLWRDVNKDGPEWFGTRCWVWTGLITSNGYGSVGHEGKSKPAHRLAFRLSGGAVKRGQEMDHLCRNRACVNPSHLEAVLPLVNALRGAGAGGEPHWPTGQSSPGVPTWDGCGCRACKEGVG